MNTETTSIRLKKIMEQKRLKQIDILNQSVKFQKQLNIKLTKSALSQYVTGKSQPAQKQLYLLALTLNVSEAWLMGYDVDQSRVNIDIQGNNNHSINDVTGNVTITNNTDTSSVTNAQATALITQNKILDVQSLSNNAVEEMLAIQKQILIYQKKIYDAMKHKNTPSHNTVEEDNVEYHVRNLLSAGHGDSAVAEDDYNYDVVYHDKYINHDVASWVYGDSMEPSYKNGEVALIKKTGFDYDGGVYAVVWDGQIFIKKVYREENGFRLVSINNKYGDKFAPFEEEPRVVGLVTGHFIPKNELQ